MLGGLTVVAAVAALGQGLLQSAKAVVAVVEVAAVVSHASTAFGYWGVVRSAQLQVVALRLPLGGRTFPGLGMGLALGAVDLGQR